MRLLASLYILLLMLTYTVQGQQLFYSEYSPLWINQELQVDSIHRQSLFNQLQILTDTGYFDTKIDSITQQGIFLSTGERYRLDNLVYEFDSEESICFLVDAAFESQTVQRFSDHVLNDLKSDGYPFASITLLETELDALNKVVSMRFRVEAGVRVNIVSLRFEGNKGLSDSYLSREVGFIAGSVFNPDLSERVVTKLQRSPFISAVQYEGILEVDNEWMMVFTVEETRRNAIDVIIGYNPSADQSSAIIGRGNLRLDNLIMEGSSARFRFERMPLDRSRLELGYSQFWLGGLPINLSVDGRFLQQDSTYFQSQFSAETHYNLSQSLSFGIMFSGANLTTTQPQGLSAIQSGRIRMAGITLQYNTLDRRLSPTSGFKTHITTRRGYRTLPADANPIYDRRYDVNELISDIQYYHTISPRWILVPRVHAHFVLTDVYFEDQLVPLGGALSLRGFREEQFRVNSVIWSDLEARYLLDRFSYLFFFGATGYINTPEAPGIPGSLTDSTQLNSAGIGLSYRIPLGMLQFSYAVSAQSPLVNGMVHFGIINSF
ncbi:MAG: BamA/TamA family outer membrane protein [Bacteroidetes bacterium]|nr:BamA/TamA family outer membrane protein [Bacteroidota bacterium]MCH8524631.1 BamA/TamA family outer membrane protein [Balneolales bacterium]